jgi:hypothetical protein
MRILFLIIALFLSFSQVAGARTSPGENGLAMFDSGSQNQDSSENDSTDTDDQEIEFISTSCSPVISVNEPEEAIFLYTNHLKSHFYFSLWRPPRY